MTTAGAGERLVASGLPAALVRDRLIDRVAAASDASHYRIVPQAVVVAGDAEMVARTMRSCAQQRLPLTFRSGGTSLSGQSVTAGVLVDTRRGFQKIEVLDDGRAVRVQPGATLRAVNAALRPYRRRLGPDPSSEGACTIGGVVANNSSGMTCGTDLNSYRTLQDLCFVLPSGTVIDTAVPGAEQRLAALEPELFRGIGELRDQVRRDPGMCAKIASQFTMKNTMGYAVNALVDFDRVTDILAHLMVGSEGTLAFIASVTFATVPLLPCASTGLLVFDGLASAAEQLPELVASGAAAIELLDAQSLRVAARDPRATARLRDLRVDDHAALLVEYQAASPQALADLVARARPLLDGRGGVGQALTSDARERADLWHVRKGLYAAVAGARKPGTTALLEDIAVPVAALPDTCSELTKLFAAHGYDDCVVFGHAKDGNIHFMLSEQFAARDGVARYAAFTEDMVGLVLSHSGTLKAEHGTGRTMASFVRRQYGDGLYAVMRAVKKLCDPRGVLNPGVLISDSPDAHLRDLKTVGLVDPDVDRCVECGFCEPVCPSRDLTLTPRQRIVVRRAVSAARESGDLQAVRQLDADHRYEGVETCAADGMCQTACPVEIDTGSLVRRLRAQRNGAARQAASRVAARHWDAITRVTAAGLTAARHAPALASALTRQARRLVGDELVPLWTRDLPRGGHRRESERAAGPDAQAVIFASCTHTIFGSASGRTTTDALKSLCAKADVPVRTAPGIAALCCGLPWTSKGLTDGATLIVERTHDSLWRASDGGRLPIVVDASSCGEALMKALTSSGLQIIDCVTFAARELLPRLRVHARHEKIAVHPTCSLVRGGRLDDLLLLANAIGAAAFVPPSWGCCGFAGDRGLLHPELTASATAAPAAEVGASGSSVYVSSNRTCEIAMSRATGRPYRHILDVLDEDACAGPGHSRKE